MRRSVAFLGCLLLAVPASAQILQQGGYGTFNQVIISAGRAAAFGGSTTPSITVGGPNSDPNIGLNVLTKGTGVLDLNSVTIDPTGNVNIPGNLTCGGGCGGGGGASFPLSYSQPAGSPLGSAISVNRYSGGLGDAPIYGSTYDLNAADGSGGNYQSMNLQTYINGAGSPAVGPAGDSYTFNSSLYLNALKSLTGGPNGSQAVAVTGGVTKSLPAGGIPAGRTVFDGFSFWGPLTNNAGVNSSQGGVEVNIELDHNTNGLDDAGDRYVYQGTVNLANPTGLAAEVGWGLYLSTVNSNASWWDNIDLGGPYSQAAIDLRYSGSDEPKITSTTPGSPTNTVTVDNILPIASGGAPVGGYGYLPALSTSAVTGITAAAAASGTSLTVSNAASLYSGITYYIYDLTTPSAVPANTTVVGPASGNNLTTSASTTIANGDTLLFSRGQKAVTINGNSYVVAAVQLSGPNTTAGTVWFTSNLSVADATNGVNILPSAHTIWMWEGQSSGPAMPPDDIAFNRAGTVTLACTQNSNCTGVTLTGSGGLTLQTPLAKSSGGTGGASLGAMLSNSQGTDGGGLNVDVTGGFNTNAGQFGSRPRWGIRPVYGGAAWSAADAGMLYPEISTTGTPYSWTVNMTQYYGLAAGSEILYEQEGTSQINASGCKTASGYSTETSGQYALARVISDGTNCLLTGDIIGNAGLLNVQVFTASGTYTATAGTRFVIVEVQAAGGGGGGAAATGAGQSSAGGGGSGGAYAKALISEGFSGSTVTIGGAGAGGAAGNNNGNGASASSFGAQVSCPGGAAGLGGAVSSAVAIGGSGGVGASTCTIASPVTLTFNSTSGSTTLGSGTNTSGLVNGMFVSGPGVPPGAYIVSFSTNSSVTISQPATGSNTGANYTFSGTQQITNTGGGSANPGMTFAAGTVALSGQGGASFYGQAGGASITSGNNGVGYGSGGSGGAEPTASSAAKAGGNGAPGEIIVYEYR